MYLRLLPFAFFLLLSCTKNDGSNTPNPTPTPGASTALYYVDSAKIYATSLTGSGRVLVAGIDTGNVNSHIGSAVRSSDGNKLYFLHYISGSAQQIKLYAVNRDGSGLTALKTMATGGSEYVLLRATADNKLVFYQAQVSGSTITTSLQTIGTDGNNAATLATIPAGSPLLRWVSQSLNRWAGVQFATTQMIKTGTLSGSLGAGTDVAAPVGSNAYALSTDGSHIAYAVKSGSTLTVKIYDVATGTTTDAFTHTIVPDIGSFTDYAAGLRWVDGTAKLLLYYGRFTMPAGSPSDFTQVVLFNRSNNTHTTWRFNGDQVYNIVAE